MVAGQREATGENEDAVDDQPNPQYPSEHGSRHERIEDHDDSGDNSEDSGENQPSAARDPSRCGAQCQLSDAVHQRIDAPNEGECCDSQSWPGEHDRPQDDGERPLPDQHPRCLLSQQFHCNSFDEVALVRGVFLPAAER
ncbi:hypothetical protein SDC9_199884 [bioreactor metagenome]|uniref:Uncharacterized protein n=1 Tax=bioreactor metagenome TaxID=1076179 RepID=A0A645ILQ6_9ZZZZ